MSARGELADLIWEDAAADRVKDGTRASLVPVVRSKVEAMADKILAAGYRRPRTITTAEELGDAIHRAFENGENLVLLSSGSWRQRPWIIWESEYDMHVTSIPVEDDPETLTLEHIDLPATILHEGTQP